MTLETEKGVKQFQLLHPCLKAVLLVQVMIANKLAMEIGKMNGELADSIYERASQNAIDMIKGKDVTVLDKAISLIDTDVANKNPWLFDE